MNSDTMVIVFGAGGRLGTRLLPLLTEQPVTCMGIAREHKPADWPHGMNWMQVDITNPAERARSLGALADIAAIHKRVVLVDLLLNRTTVAAMRTSIAAITAYVVRLHSRLAAAEKPCSLITASTTATLAPWLYQTPYGIAKRRQLFRYTSSGLPGTAFLLPSLEETADRCSVTGHSWSYTHAAKMIAEERPQHRHLTHDSSATWRVVVPQSEMLALGTAVERWSSPIYVARQFMSTHSSLAVGWQSPQKHREASRNRLALTPFRIRQHVDHHRAPSFLVKRMKRSLQTQVETID